MQIHVEFMAFIERPNGLPRKFNKEINDKVSVKQLLLDIGFNSSSIHQMQFFISTTKDKDLGGRVRKNYIFRSNDHLFVTIPIGGG